MVEVSRVQSFNKALHVVLSCNTREQLNSAERYVMLFEKTFPEGRKAEQMGLVLYMKIRERRRLLQNLKYKMLRIILKKGENITKALKRFKQKVRNTKLMQEVRERKQFDKPSVKKRANKKKAIRVNQWKLKDEE